MRASCHGAARSAGPRSSARRPLPLLDPAPAGRFQVAERHAARALRAGGLEGRRDDRAPGGCRRSSWPAKSRSTLPGPMTRRAIFGVLREEFPSCFVFCVGRGSAALVAASPELLVRREGQRVETLALAGSTRRSADPAVDDSPGRAAAARPELPRGARDRRPPDRADAAPALGMGRRGARARARADRQHPASRDADPRPARSACRGARAGRPDAPHAGRRRRAAERRGAADPGPRGPRPRLVRGPGRLDRHDRRRRVLRRPALRPAARQHRPLLRRQRHRRATPTPPASWPRRRSSSRPCCPCWRAERARTPRPRPCGAARRSRPAGCAPR